MERKNLKTILHQVAASIVGVGTSSLVPDRIVGFDISTRARQAIYLKTARVVISENEAGAGYAYVARAIIKRNAVAQLVNVAFPSNDAVIQALTRGTDQYGYLSSSSRGTIYQQPVEWEFPDGFEPVFVDVPHSVAFVTAALGAGLHQISFDWEFRFWIEEKTEKEYEFLKRLYGPLG